MKFVARVEQATHLDKVKIDIKARIEDFFNVGANKSKTLQNDKSWRMDHIIYGAYGYPSALNKPGAQSKDLNDALDYLNALRNTDPIGEIRRVKLNIIR
jgi:hypothetical protein